MSKRILLTCIISLMLVTVYARQNPVGLSANSGSVSGLPDKFGRPTPDSRGWTDPAIANNRLLWDRDGEGYLTMVGTFKVKGSPFLYGGVRNGIVYSEKEKAWNILINYNTYNQELEFFSTSNRSNALVKAPGDLDSFVFLKSEIPGMEKNLKFIYGPLIGARDKVYFQEVYAGEKYSLYKAYKSTLGMVSSSFQTDLRQFELEYDYYYSATGQKGLKKLKKNPSAVIKEFETKTDLRNIVTSEAFNLNPEEALQKAFDSLNKN